MRVITFHGIGNDTPSTYAKAAMTRLGRQLPGLRHASVHWGPLLDVPQREMMRDMRKRGSKGNLVQGISYKTLGDALAYRNVEGAVRLLADYETNNLGGSVDVVVAHSLGCVLALGWLNSRSFANPVTLVTLGCNLGLWQAGADAKIPKPRPVHRWLNLFDATDGLGGPIGGIAHARDIEVSVGRPWYAFMVPAADHVGYWNDADLWSRTLPNLLRL